MSAIAQYLQGIGKMYREATDIFILMNTIKPRNNLKMKE